jgi:hypothetical protein
MKTGIARPYACNPAATKSSKGEDMLNVRKSHDLRVMNPNVRHNDE